MEGRLIINTLTELLNISLVTLFRTIFQQSSTICYARGCVVFSWKMIHYLKLIQNKHSVFIRLKTID